MNLIEENYCASSPNMGFAAHFIRPNASHFAKPQKGGPKLRATDTDHKRVNRKNYKKHDRRLEK